MSLPLPETKQCYKCKHFLPLEEFHKDKLKQDGLQSHCKKCGRKYQESRRKKLSKRKSIKVPKYKKCLLCKEVKESKFFNVERGRLDGLQNRCIPCVRRLQLKIKYHITPEEWEIIFDKQGRRCAICNNNVTNKVGWVLDHNHETGKNRAILCDSCNKMLGHAKENQQTLIAGANYLKSDGLSWMN